MKTRAACGTRKAQQVDWWWKAAPFQKIYWNCTCDSGGSE